MHLHKIASTQDILVVADKAHSSHPKATIPGNHEVQFHDKQRKESKEENSPEILWRSMLVV
jgi:hypothetical protein